MYIGAKGDQKEGFIEPAAWMKMPPVENDRFEKIGLNDWQKVTGVGADLSKLPASEGER